MNSGKASMKLSNLPLHREVVEFSVAPPHIKDQSSNIITVFSDNPSPASSVSSNVEVGKLPPVQVLCHGIPNTFSGDIFTSDANISKPPPRMFIKRSKPKYRLIRKSPQKGSPVKTITQILRKHKKKKKKGLSPRKLQFILPKVTTKFRPKKLSVLKSKSLQKSSTSFPKAQENQAGFSANPSFKNSLRVVLPNTCQETPNYTEITLSESNSSVVPQNDASVQKEVPTSSKCEEDLEEEEEAEEPQQQEEYLAAFLKASSTIVSSQRSGERRNSEGARELRLTKQQRRLRERIEAMSRVPDLREQQDVLVTSYLVRVKEALLSAADDAFGRFVEALNGIASRGESVESVFFKVMEILKGFPDLQDGFVMFLRPDQAIRVGKYSEFILMQRMREFVYELKHYFSRQPQHLQKVSKTLQTLISQENLNCQEVLTSLTPLLRLQPWLLESLTFIFHTSKPQKSLPVDFEEISLEEPVSPDGGFEHINLVDEDTKPPSENCPCDCHVPQTPPPPANSANLSSQAKLEHCISCALRFIDGRVFLQCGKALRPAKVTILSPTKDEGDDTPSSAPPDKKGGCRGHPYNEKLKSSPKGGSEGEKARKGRKTRKT